MCFITPMLTAGVGHLWGQAQISNGDTDHQSTAALELSLAESGRHRFCEPVGEGEGSVSPRNLARPPLFEVTL